MIGGEGLIPPSDSEPSRKLRVALVSSSYNYIRDGVALTLNRLVEYLERQGVEVLVFAPVAPTPAFAHKGTIVPVPSIALPMRPEYRLALGLPRALRKRLREFDPDIIHIAVPDLLGYCALRFALKRNVPVVASYHTRYETYLKHYWFSGMTRPVTAYLHYFYGACRELYVPSASMAEALVTGGQRNNIRLWPRGVDAVHFNPAKRSDSWRGKYGIGPDELVILFVGRLVREKQLHTLTAVFRELSAAGIAHRSLIVGDGPDGDTLKRQLPDGVFTGAIFGEELATAYASSDIFLFPSDTETFGNVTLEAMASGLPAVCADATGSRSLVDVGVTGFLEKPGSTADFVKPLRLLAADAELRRRMGSAARLRSLSFTWDAAMALLLGYYTALAKSVPVRAADTRT